MGVIHELYLQTVVSVFKLFQGHKERLRGKKLTGTALQFEVSQRKVLITKSNQVLSSVS